MKTSRQTNLSQQIEQLVQAHLTAIRAEAEAALAGAFASVVGVGETATAKRRPSFGTSKRRSRKELNVVAERLLELVVANPGASITALAPKLGLSPRELQRPMGHLKRAGRVRSVGQRHLTRYFPLAYEGNLANG